MQKRSGNISQKTKAARAALSIPSLSYAETVHAKTERVMQSLHNLLWRQSFAGFFDWGGLVDSLPTTLMLLLKATCYQDSMLTQAWSKALDNPKMRANRKGNQFDQDIDK